ncbi:MAG: hypothetical protein ACJAUP_001387 [Cellvibrionaceae bacterium]|jgi:hypothetical protein
MTENKQSLDKPRPHLRSITPGKVTTYGIKVAAWINHCQEVAVNQADMLFDEFEKIAKDKLDENITNATTNQGNLVALDNLHEFKDNIDRLKLNFGDQINHGFDLFQRKALSTYLREPHPDDKIWSLIDNDELEETISIKTIAHESNIEFQDELWRLEKRFGSINGGEAVNEHNNPVSPLQFCIALRSSLTLTSLNTESKLTAYKVFASLIYKYLEPLYSTTNEYFISEGILPNLRYDKGITESTYDVKGNVDQNPYLEEAEKASNGSENIYNDQPIKDGDQIQLVYAIRSLLQQTRSYEVDDALSKAPASYDATPLHNGPSQKIHHPPILFVNQQIIDAVENIQSTKTTLAHETNRLDSQSIIETNRQITEELAKDSPDGRVDPQDMYTIDLVGILFEYILTDDSLPDSVKTLLSHLHTPFLKLAFIDTQFFEKPEHPARLLLDSLAEAGASWVNNDGSAQYDMYNEIKAAIMRIMDEFKNDVRLFAEILFEFNRLKNKLNHKHQLKERNTIERVQGQERLRLAKQRGKKELETRVKGIKLPSAVIQLLKPWFTYLTLLQLRDSNNEALWKQALRVVDELAYFFNFGNKNTDRSELESRFNGILTAVKIGFNTMGHDQTKAKKILVDLTALKIATIKKYVTQPETAADKINVSTQVTPTNTEGNVKPLPIKEPEPIKPEEEEGNATPEEEKVINYLKLIEPGTWFEFKGNVRLKVNGFSSKLMKYMLVDSTSHKVVMISRLDLARKIMSGDSKIVAGSTKPLFERALERIFQKLDKEAKSLN